MRDCWRRPPQERHQLILFSSSLDDMIGVDHPIRRLDELLCEVDWSLWEANYAGHRGQPPIHPKLVAGVILYGLLLGLRSSRKLEDATRHRTDLMWFLCGMTIDHSTLAAFRTGFESELKDLFRQVNRIAMKRLNTMLTELAVDGTRVRSQSSRTGSRSADSLRQQLEAADRLMHQALAEMAAADANETPSAVSPMDIRRELSKLRGQQYRLKKALAKARKRDKKKRKKDGKKAKPVRVPVNDPDSHILPNKDGGYAPNYTPIAAVDKDTGLIVHSDIVEGNAEADAVQETIEEVKEHYECVPERVSCDGGLGTGANQEALEKQGIEIYTPVESLSTEDHLAFRPDPCQPVAEELWDQLPRYGKQLDRTCFLYDAESNSFWCPMGRTLHFERITYNNPKNGRTRVDSYICDDCSDCPLSDQCLSKKAKRRRINRDQYEAARERTAQRMATDAGKEIYSRRKWIAETPFGFIKNAMGIRQFFYVGIKKARMEWQWVTSAYNLMKALRA